VTPPSPRSHRPQTSSVLLNSVKDDFSKGRPATSALSLKSSLQLVEETKVDDPDKFKIWEVGGRANTPNSFWKEQRTNDGGMEAVASPCARPHLWTSLSHLKVRAMQEKGHMRAMLLPSTPSSAESSLTRNLDGLWVSTDGELRGKVEGNMLRWDCDGSQSRLRLGGERQEIVTMAVDGVRHFGALSEDGHRLIWADGDVWVRHDNDADSLAKVVKDQCGEDKPSRHRPVGWSKWKLHWRPNSSGPAWPRPTSPTKRLSPVEPGISMCSWPSVALPPLKGVLILRR